MKKVLAFLFICLSSTVMFAQAHWTPLVAPEYDGDYMAINASIFINDVEQFDDNLELAVFVDLGNGELGECRAVRYPARVLPNGVYYYSLTVKGQENELYTFRLYDHGLDQELDYEVVFPADYPQLDYQHGESIGALRNPWHACFVSGATEPITKEIIGYEQENGGWYLISSPVGALDNAEMVENMVEGTYDLYYFNQAGDDDGNEWINYEGPDGNFGLELGKGYLYANLAELTTLTFPGTAYTGEGTFGLEFNEEASDPYFVGMNLMGNPYNSNATVDREFYTMELNGAFTAHDAMEEINPMEGVIVNAENAGETVTFAPVEQGQGEKRANLALNLTNGGKVLDRAIVGFGQGGTLPKIQFNRNSSKVYFPVDGNDYALVRSEGMGELPVNFKAENNGSYNLTLSAQNVDFAYLHLVDNLTGADQDLLANPSYSFNANTTDYASRFRLVFATGNNEDNFAFFSNGNLVVSNEGNATLQVVDVTGRIIKCENINGCASVSIDAAPGVYMVRLVNGDNVKVQKVVK